MSAIKHYLPDEDEEQAEEPTREEMETEAREMAILREDTLREEAFIAEQKRERAEWLLDYQDGQRGAA